MYRLALTALLLALSLSPCRADVDQRAAREALRAGEIRPLMELLTLVEKQCKGDLVEVELERDDNNWYYEIKLLGPAGDVAELEYHAATFRLIEAEGRNLSALACVPAGTPH